MPDYSKDSPDKARQTLAGFGTLVGAFNQKTFRTELGSKQVTKIGGKTLGNGYCMGVGLDWIRRVLQSKADRDASYLTYSYDALSKKEGKKGRTLEELKVRTLDTSLRMGKAYYRQTEEMDWTGPKGVPTKSVLPEDWKKVAKDLDSDFDDSRAESIPKRKESKKRFGNLILLDSKSTTYAKAGKWMATILGDTVLSPGHCVLTGFSEVGKNGHGIVIWRRRNNKTQNDSYYFFDPNFGVFSYNEDGLQGALQYLFWRDEDDTPFYADCSSLDKQEMLYMIFGPPNVV